MLANGPAKGSLAQALHQSLRMAYKAATANMHSLLCCGPDLKSRATAEIRG